MRLKVIAALVLVFVSRPGIGALDQNFPARKALVVNSCPHVELSGFGYNNAYSDRATRFHQNLKWKNVGTQALVAFEVIVLKYDPFDSRLIGTRWTITGTNSADWSPLEPGEGSADGTSSYGDEEVFTAIAYVRAARLADGTVWTVEPQALLAQLKKVAPDLKQFGSLDPDPVPPKQQP